MQWRGLPPALFVTAKGLAIPGLQEGIDLSHLYHHIQSAGIEGNNTEQRSNTVGPAKLAIGMEHGHQMRTGGMAHEDQFATIAAPLPCPGLNSGHRSGEMMGLGQGAHALVTIG